MQLPCEVVLLLERLLDYQVVRGLVRLAAAAVRGVLVRLRDLVHLDPLDELLKVQQLLLVPVDLNDGAESLSAIGPCVVLGALRCRLLVALLALLPSAFLCRLLAEWRLRCDELGGAESGIGLGEWLLS